MTRLFYLIIFLFSLFAFSFCSQKKQSSSASFYFWRTTFNLSPEEKKALTHFNTKELYVRFFDVDKTDDSIGFLGEIQGLEKIPDSLSVIPVIFITNRTFLDLSNEKVVGLAQKIHKKIKNT
ncbi:MAG: hypothetical protein IAF38_19425, partial [Bacteroidia bacterium]|nr:hypothetical protein [Bacteroidia bacterium]